MIAPAHICDITRNTSPGLVSGILKTDERTDFQSEDSSVETDSLRFSSENQLKTMMHGWMISFC